MRASAASELENFRIFTSKNWYFFQYFVGNSYTCTLSVQMTCLSAYMYRQTSKCTDKTLKKHYWGGGGQLPPPPSGYASDRAQSLQKSLIAFTVSTCIYIDQPLTKISQNFLFYTCTCKITFQSFKVKKWEGHSSFLSPLPPPPKKKRRRRNNNQSNMVTIGIENKS